MPWAKEKECLGNEKRHLSPYFIHGILPGNHNMSTKHTGMPAWNTIKWTLDIDTVAWHQNVPWMIDGSEMDRCTANQCNATTFTFRIKEAESKQ